MTAANEGAKHFLLKVESHLGVFLMVGEPNDFSCTMSIHFNYCVYCVVYLSGG